MPAEVILTEEAARSLAASVDYIESRLGSPAAARALEDAFETVARRISDFPTCYPLSQEARLRRLGYRKALVNGYLMLYRVEGNRVYITNFFHQSQDYARLV